MSSGRNVCTYEKCSLLYKIFSILIALGIGLGVGFLATGCTRLPSNLEENWTYSDLHAIDPIEGITPEAELIAYYSRVVDDDIQIRLDLLDVDPSQFIDLHLLFDFKPGGSTESPGGYQVASADFYWEYELHISNANYITVADSNGNAIENLGVSIYRDSFMDTIYISLPGGVFGHKIDPYTIVAIAASPSSSVDSTTAYDTLGPSRSDSPPPPAVKVLLAFWDTFQSATPAQALRSWDGAHTGPDSNRHGLRFLFDAANKYRLPIHILDANEKETMSALEYLGVGDVSMLLKRTGLLFGRLICGNYDYAHYIYIDNSTSATTDGLSVSAIRRIIDSANDISDNPVILGGSFKGSSWGTPDATDPTLAYIAGHPWIQLVGDDDLTLNQACSNSVASSEYTSKNHLKIIEAHNSINTNILSELAWNTYTMLVQPSSPQLDLIRDNYIGQVGHIFAAAQWANSPVPISDCSIDIDWDGEEECILANTKIFTTYELNGGYLAFAFYLADDGPHQIIGPTYQLSLGLSDPSSWDANNGLEADPGQILGAFINQPTLSQVYEYNISSNKIELISSDMAMRKLFVLTDSSINTQISDNVQLDNFQIPFIIDPWIRYQPNWVSLYNINNIGDRWILSAGESISIQVYSSGEFVESSFLDPLKAITQSEDPNAEYTRGYFLPFPLILMETQKANSVTIEIQQHP